MNEAIVKKKTRFDGFIRIVTQYAANTISQKDIGGYIKWIDATGTTKRTVSIYAVNEEEETMTLDFVDHGKNGEMAKWARECKVEDQFNYLGPGPVANISLDGEEFIFLGDKTAFPAIMSQLKRIQNENIEASIYVGLEASKEEVDEYFSTFIKLKNTHFLSVSESSEEMTFVNLFEEFYNDIKNKKVLWCAGERSKVIPIRKLAKEISEDLIDKYISSYWQNGLNDEDHKKLKAQDK